jgi:hypothetical protein
MWYVLIGLWQVPKRTTSNISRSNINKTFSAKCVIGFNIRSRETESHSMWHWHQLAYLSMSIRRHLQVFKIRPSESMKSSGHLEFPWWVDKVLEWMTRSTSRNLKGPRTRLRKWLKRWTAVGKSGKKRQGKRRRANLTELTEQRGSEFQKTAGCQGDDQSTRHVVRSG